MELSLDKIYAHYNELTNGNAIATSILILANQLSLQQSRTADAVEEAGNSINHLADIFSGNAHSGDFRVCVDVSHAE